MAYHVDVPSMFDAYYAAVICVFWPQ